MQDSVVFFELPADEPVRAREFYEKAFGWKVTSNPALRVQMLGTAPSDERGRATTRGAINGILSQRKNSDSATVITIDVEDIDSAIERVKANGGRVVQMKQEIRGIGYAAYFKDTEGNKLGLFQSARSRGGEQ